MTDYFGRITTTAATHTWIWSPKSKLSEILALKDAMCLHMAQYIFMYQIPIKLCNKFQLIVLDAVSGSEKPHSAFVCLTKGICF